jgi:diguanylate cyclase (GGDEF)-like protein
LALIGPSILCVFGLAFFWAWTIEKTRPYLLLLATAPFCFALAMTMQVFHYPAGFAENALMSGFFDTVAVLLTAEAILRRSGKRFGWPVDLFILAIMIIGLWRFAYIDPDVSVRVYIQNFGYGFILLAAALRIVPLKNSKPTEHVLFWMFFLFAIHFFPRTALTIGLTPPPNAKAFGASLFWQLLHLSLAVLGAGLAMAILAAVISDVIDDLRRECDVDKLTGILNRRGFESHASALVAQGECVLITCDLDYFKQINDSYGHAAGDRVLKVFGELLRNSTRSTDVVGRIGGEEFAILLIGADHADAFNFAERLRLRLSQVDFECLPLGRRVTASLGIAEMMPGEDILQLLARADECLYQAKASGRNQTI